MYYQRIALYWKIYLGKNTAFIIFYCFLNLVNTITIHAAITSGTINTPNVPFTIIAASGTALMSFISYDSVSTSNRKNSNDTTECLFSHGIAGAGKQVQNYIKKSVTDNTEQSHHYFTIEVPATTFDYPDATDRFWRVNFWRTSFGQKNEIDALKNALDQRKEWYKNNKPAFSDIAIEESADDSHKDTLPNTHNSNNQSQPAQFILYGLSRGASTIVTFMTTYPETENICALVLESPYDQVVSVATAFASRLRIPYFSSFIHVLMRMLFMQYDKNGISPLHNIDKISKNIPILIVCSLEDKLVPWQSSFAIYTALRNAGHNNTHILVLEKGAHANLFSEKYQNVVHAFYQKYKLPHDKDAALRGTQSFGEYQP